ncbi:MAG: hypothetical protein QOH88_488 [Verrucomicrobiota bacterium]
MSLALLAALLGPLLVYASAPSWWSSRGVLVQNAAADDYAPANQGQLKHIAKAAVAEMDATLKGGAGNALRGLIASWSTPSPGSDDFAPVNLGQLKNVAKLFYDRLISVGLIDYYPWLSALTPSDDFAIANIGQVKKLFSFEIPAPNPLDDPLGDRITAGQFSANLALEVNAVWIWADHFSSGNDFERNYPRRLGGLSSIRSVSAGDRHVVALRSDGTVWAWGENGFGQLGDNTNANRLTPGPVPNLADIVSVKAGGLHNLALQADGTVVAWGDNYYGQLGTGDTTSSSTPTLVAGLSAVRKIAAGYQRSAALTTDGLVWTWGYEHYYGQDIFNVSPAAVPDLGDVVDIAVGYEHVVAVKADGTVWAWGSNYSHQLGNGITSYQYQSVPVQVSNLSNIVKVASSWDHTLALASDGTVWAWGYNSAGQLGDGTSQARQTPVQVSGLADVIAIATNWSYSLAMKADGTVWTWGDGSSGTLPGVDLHVPQQVGLGVLDTNNNGIDDRWEMQYLGNLGATSESDFDGDGVSDLQEYRRGTDPTDYFNGAAPIIEIVSGNNQQSEAGTFLAKPLTVRVRSAAGVALTNAPVTFAITSGAGGLAVSVGESVQNSILVRTDATGQARAYHALPLSSGTGSRITASSGPPTAIVSTVFRAYSPYRLPPTVTPTPTPDPNASPTPTPGPAAAPVAPYRYAVIDLGKDMYPIRINNKGWVLLMGYDANDNWGYFRWKGGVLERLTFPHPNGSASAMDMNDEGLAVGYLERAVPWVNNAVNEIQAGLKWPANNSTGVKVSAPAVPTLDFRHPGSVRQATFNAVNNNNDIYGGARTGAVIGFLFNPIGIFNAYRWSADNTAATQLSDASASADPVDLFVWHLSGSTDTILRANSAGHYIGRKFTPSATISGLYQGIETGMVDGQTVTIAPVDLNEAGLVAGNRPDGGAMVIKTLVNPPFAAVADVVLEGVSPLAINDHVRPATSAQPSATPSPTPIPAPQVLSWAGNALVLWERQEDGKTWSPFGLEEMIPSMDSWENLEPTDMNNDGAIIGRAWYTDPSQPNAPGEQHAFLLAPVELMVDANRDGEMSFEDSVVHDGDRTSEEKPYRFWLNDDDDGAAGDPGEHVPVSTPDYADGVIRSSRDLEDFARLHLNLKGLDKALESGSVKVAFEWREISGNPKLKLYRAVSGGTEYLTNTATANSASLSPFRDTLGEVVPGSPLFMPQSFWLSTSPYANVPKTLPVTWLLFEGSGEGKGQLVLTFWKDSYKIGEAPGVWFDLKDIKKMYQRQDASGRNQWPSVAFEPDPNASDQTIVFVHGWNQSPDGSSSFAETMYKRLWQRGFKGRYAALRWNTHWSSTFNNVPGIGQTLDAYLAHYNDSEHEAWLAGEGLKNFVTSLPGTSKNVIAHSMGNVVVGSALRRGMAIDNYALLHGAVPASCYDTGSYLEQPQVPGAFGYYYWDARTPDDDSGPLTRALAYRGQLSTANANLVNFYLSQDRATTYAWEFNNRVFKPNSGFFYGRNQVDGSRLWKNEFGIRRSLTDAEEAMPYGDQSWSKVVGAEDRTEGVINDKVNLASAAYSLPADAGGFKDEHSAEFDRAIQQQLQPFYYDLLQKLGMSQNYLSEQRP